MSIFEEMSLEVAGYASQCVDIPLIDFIMEEDNPETSEALKKNEEMMAKSENVFRKIIAGIRKMFQKLIDMVNGIIEKFGASKEEKVKYDQMVKELRESEEFKGMKLTFRDFRKINDEMESAVKTAEDEYRKFKESDAENNPNIIKTLNNKMQALGIQSKEVMQAEGASFAIEVAIKYAQQNRSHAAAVKKMLDFDMGLLAGLEKEIGKKEFQKARKKINKLNSQFGIVRAIAGGRNQQLKTLNDAVNDVTGSMWSLWKVHRRAKKSAHGAEVKASEKAVVKLGLWAHGKKVAGRQQAADEVAALKQKSKMMDETVKGYQKAHQNLDSQLNDLASK